MVADLRLHTVTLWAFGSKFSGRNLLIYLLLISAGIIAAWLIRATAVICDSNLFSGFI